MESEVLAIYAEPALVNVPSVGFVIHLEALHLGASPDGRVYETTDDPPFGLVEVKSTIKNDASQAAHFKVLDGHANLKHSHRWRVQGQLAITGLEWCDFDTDTRTDLTVERVWRDNGEAKLDVYYYNTYMNVYLTLG